MQLTPCRAGQRGALLLLLSHQVRIETWRNRFDKDPHIGGYFIPVLHHGKQSMSKGWSSDWGTSFENSRAPMWLIVCLITWSVLSSVTTGYDNRNVLTEPESWGQCRALLTIDKFSPSRVDLRSQQPECKIWRPQLAARFNIPTLQTPCVFSQASFRNGHGLSLVTMSDVVSDLLDQGTLDERDQHDLDGSSSPPDIVPGPVLDPKTRIPAYEVRNLPGKGKGVIALRRIKQNETFLLDYPAVLVSWDLIGLSWTKTQEFLLESALNQLPEDARRRVLGLSKASLVPDLPLCDLFKTNICGLWLSTGAPHVGLFPEFAVSYFERVRK